MAADEYVLDTPRVREFVTAVREAITEAASPEDACEAIRPRFAELLADPDWLPAEYQEGVPEGGMGGGIGTWLLFRAGDGSLSLISLAVPSGSQTPNPRPPCVGPRRPVPRHAGRGGLRGTRLGLRARRAASAGAG